MRYPKRRCHANVSARRLRMKKYRIILSEDQRAVLQQMIAAGQTPARTLTHARILLKADEGEHGPGWTDDQIHEALEVGLATIQRVRQRFIEHGLDDALHRRQPERPEKRKIAGAQEAHQIALSCDLAPQGYQHWSARRLADRFIVVETGEKVGRETI